MRQLIETNHALGNRAELDRIWAEQGYWFFRDVLDHDAIAALREEYMVELRALGVVDPASPEPVWNGKDLTGFPATIETLHQRKVWQSFVADERINRFFEDVLNDQIYWIPIDYYRIVPPSRKDASNAYLALHQDGMSNPGVDFVTCWMPLTDIDDSVGGLVIADGQHERGYMDVIDGRAQFAEGPAIPDECWARADYRPGDVVIFTTSMPHYGLGNTSDKFRLSLDIRAARRSGRLPVVGRVRSISPDRVVIADEEAGDVALRLSDATFLRGPGKPNPVPITRDRAPAELPPGSAVMATREGDLALVLRPHF